MRGFGDDDRPRPGRYAAPGLKLVAIAIVSLALMTVDQAQAGLAPVRDGLAVALAPIQAAAALPGQALAYLERFFDRDALIERNQRLARQVLLLRGRLQKLAALQAENERIRALLDSAGTLNQNVLIARITAVSPGPYRGYVKLNKGATDGVFVGQAVIDAHGVMGQVTAVTPLAARVALISDADRGVPVAINRTGLETIARGSGRGNALSLPFLTHHADIKSGDLLVTSGLGGRYPAGYPVARVTRIAYRPGQAFLDVAAKPTAELDRSREVLLVWNKKPASARQRAPFKAGAARFRKDP